ncbi:MAG TPA: hypothetical protein VGJ63_10705 [Micromonosporaceae bacterium]|jgi:hypothetical protein
MTAALGHDTEPAETSRTAGRAAPGRRWLPLGSALVAVVVILVAADTSWWDLARYAAYATLAVALPGTLVYRSLRRTPHTFVEDVAMGLAVGLALEIAGWAAFSVAGLQGWLWLWPLAVIGPFATVPALRRHWFVRDYQSTPVGWSWVVAGTVVFFTWYLSAVFLERNPILPTSENTRQYLDLAYLLSVAGEAKHTFPPEYPHVADEPLYYHWFAQTHMAVTSLIAHIDLPVVAMRLAIPALCALAIVLTAVVGWRISGRPYVGAGAAVLFFVIGEVNFTHPVTAPFGTQATFVVWHGMSMIYSWVLVIALIAALAEIVGRTAASRVPPLGTPGAFTLAGLLLLTSAGAKASTLPVVLAALGFTAVILGVARRAVPWRVVAALGLAAVTQLLATAVLFHFQTYGVRLKPLTDVSKYWNSVTDAPGWPRPLVVLVVFLAFYLNMQLRTAGILALVWLRRGRLDPVQVLLLGGALGGPLLYLVFDQARGGQQYFTRVGFAFGVILSAWGYAMVLDRAHPTARTKVALAAGAAVFAGALILVQLGVASPAPPSTEPYGPLLPLLAWSLAFTLLGLVIVAMWPLVTRVWPGLLGRGGVIALTGVLVFGAPGLIMDMYKSIQAPNGGPYFTIVLPRSRVEAARWVRDHSRPDDIVATNMHCLQWSLSRCDPASMWLAAYAERSVLVEGWDFSPRMQLPGPERPFWDPERLRLNDEAFTDPDANKLRDLRQRYRVRYLVADRSVGPVSPVLESLADLRFENARVAVYELR